MSSAATIRDLQDSLIKTKSELDNQIIKGVLTFQSGKKINVSIKGNEGRSLEMRSSGDSLIVTYHANKDDGFVRTYNKNSKNPVSEESIKDLLKAKPLKVANHDKHATLTTSLLRKGK